MYKDLSDRYYPNNKVTLQKKANERYQNLSGQKKRIHYEQFINFAEGKKQRLVKHIKKYYKMW